MENEFPPAGGRIDVLGERLKADVAGVKLGKAFEEVFEGAAKPIKPPNDKDIAAPYVVECLFQPLRSVFAPLAVSVNALLHSAFVSASSCKCKVFCDSALLSQTNARELYQGDLGHGLHNRRYQIFGRLTR